MTRCRSCDAPIIFAKVTGEHGRVRTMPFDSQPEMYGEWLVAGETARYIGKEPSLFPAGRYRIHKCKEENP